MKENIQNNIDLLSKVDLKETALQNYKKTGLPNSKDERWKYTDVSKLVGNRVTIGVEFENFYEFNIVSTNNDITIEDIRNIGENNRLKELIGSVIGANYNGLTSLNLCDYSNGYFIDVPSKLNYGTIVINHKFIGEKVNNNIRNLINVNNLSNLNIIELFENGNEDYQFNNIVTEIIANEGAEVNHIRIFNLDHLSENKNNVHIHTLGINQKKGSTVSSYTFMINANVLRNEIYQHLEGERSEGNLVGLYVPSGSQHFDTFTFVDHHAPNCLSNELYKGLLKDKSTAIFNGKILVREQAQKTNAYQSSKNILLSADAKLNAKPQLEIFADDVKCSHGATTGQFDEDALFYLMARGVEKTKAENLLSFAFINDVIGKCTDITAQDMITEIINNKYSIKEFI